MRERIVSRHDPCAHARDFRALERIRKLREVAQSFLELGFLPAKIDRQARRAKHDVFRAHGFEQLVSSALIRANSLPNGSIDSNPCAWASSISSR
jgi:hypothetical protein